MSIRSFVVSTLLADPDISALVENRVYMEGAMMTAQVARPFLLVSFNANTDEQIFDDPDIEARPTRQFFWVWAHDARPSYLIVDELCNLVKNTFRVTSSSPDDSLMDVRFIDQSADSKDPVFDTGCRYMRFQAVMSK